MIKKKVILTGSFGVGKTSLFKRFLYNEFSDKYLTTIGVKVDKKNIEVDGQEVSLMLWDIAGEIAQNKVPDSYFLQSSAILYVFDLTRPSTYGNIEVDLKYLEDKIPGGLIKVVANKRDLVSDEELEKVTSEVARKPDITTSAKTGDNVEELFFELAKKLIDSDF